ncbi:MAG: hypothetical protein ACI4F6_10440 [Acutalibacteraceae bacterium]
MKAKNNVKFYSVFLILALISATFLLAGCENKNNTDYKALPGYKEYISDSDKGYEDMPYFYVIDSMEESEEAREYFKANSRQCGEYIITDYEDGVCINKYRLNHTISVLDTLDVPETLDGKPVVKIGGYLQENSQDSLLPYEVISAFGGLRGCTLNLPKTVKVITADSIDSCSFALEDDERVKFPVFIGINVDKENPYYSSEDGLLYSKDKKKLLFMNFNYKMNSDYESNNYIVPEFVESFEPLLGVPHGLTSIEFGNNVKSINTYIDRGEGETPNIVVRGYKGTAAEEWAKQEDVKFEALD